MPVIGEFDAWPVRTRRYVAAVPCSRPAGAEARFGRMPARYWYSGGTKPASQTSSFFLSGMHHHLSNIPDGMQTTHTHNNHKRRREQSVLSGQEKTFHRTSCVRAMSVCAVSTQDTMTIDMMNHNPTSEGLSSVTRRPAERRSNGNSRAARSSASLPSVLPTLTRMSPSTQPP